MGIRGLGVPSGDRGQRGGDPRTGLAPPDPYHCGGLWRLIGLGVGDLGIGFGTELEAPVLRTGLGVSQFLLTLGFAP